MKNEKLQRNSGIELLKLIAILLIITAHVVQTLGKKPDYYPADDYVIIYSLASTDLKNIVLSIFRDCGYIGNTIFFVCSAWFLVDRNRNEKSKAFQIIVENWVISVTILVLFLAFWGKVNGSLILRSFFPLYFCNNWYINCYVLFLLIYPILNRTMEMQGEKGVFRSTIFLILSFIVLPFSGIIFRYLFIFFSKLFS